jgi:ribosome recycling factor
MREAAVALVIADLKKTTEQKMDKSVQAFKGDLAKVRTGRAHTGILDHVMVDYYGAATPLKQLATINVPEARLLTVQPYDQASIKAIEKAIMESDIGLTPNNDGRLIRMSIPELNEERRRDLVKVVRHIAEEGRVAIRNIRRDVMHDLRELKESGDAGADDEHRAEVELQKLTDARIAELETALKAKEAEILEV